MGRLFISPVGVQLYFGVDPLFENQLLVLFELVTVFQALVLVLADQFTSNARALAHGFGLPVADFNLHHISLNPFINHNLAVMSIKTLSWASPERTVQSESERVFIRKSPMTYNPSFVRRISAPLYH